MIDLYNIKLQNECKNKTAHKKFIQENKLASF